MPRTNQRVWYVTDARINVNFTTGFTATSDGSAFTSNANVTRLTATVTTVNGSEQIGTVSCQDWASTGDVINPQTLKVARDEAASTTPPTAPIGTPATGKGGWGVRVITANYTLSKKDYPFVVIKSTSSTAITITVPDDADLSFPLETPIKWRQTGSGQITFVGASGVTINSISGNKKSSAQHAGGELTKSTAHTWHLSGGLVA